MGLWDLLQPPDIPSTLVILRRGDIKDELSALSPLKCHWRNGLHFVRLTCSWASLKFKNKANSGYLFLKHLQAGVPLPASPMFPLLFCPPGERCFLWRRLALRNPVLSRAWWPPQGKRSQGTAENWAEGKEEDAESILCPTAESAGPGAFLPAPLISSLLLSCSGNLHSCLASCAVLASAQMSSPGQSLHLLPASLMMLHNACW